jgi:hypothetical protein
MARRRIDELEPGGTYGFSASNINAWSASFYAWSASFYAWGVATGNWHPLSSGYQP